MYGVMAGSNYIFGIIKLIFVLKFGPRPSRTKMMSMSMISDVFIACKRGDIARVRQAVADGVDVRKVINVNWHNETPLHHACR